MLHTVLWALAQLPGGPPPDSASPAAEAWPNLPFDVQIIAVLVVGFLAGSFGGLIYELIVLQGSVERGHRLTEEEWEIKDAHAVPGFMYDLGWRARALIGGAAGVAVFLVFEPGSWITLVATSVVAGSAGISLFRSLQDRLLSAVANARLNALVRRAEVVDADLLELLETSEGIRMAVQGTRAVDRVDLEQEVRRLSEKISRVRGALSVH